MLVVTVELVMVESRWWSALSDAFCSLRRRFGRGRPCVGSSSLSVFDASRVFVLSASVWVGVVVGAELAECE